MGAHNLKVRDFLKMQSVLLKCTYGILERLQKLNQSLDFIAPLWTRCLLGKFDRRPFRPTAQKPGSVCEKVHIDIQGPHGYYSGVSVAYLMQKKSDALQCY